MLSAQPKATRIPPSQAPIAHFVLLPPPCSAPHTASHPPDSHQAPPRPRSQRRTALRAAAAPPVSAASRSQSDVLDFVLGAPEEDVLTHDGLDSQPVPRELFRSFIPVSHSAAPSLPASGHIRPRLARPGRRGTVAGIQLTNEIMACQEWAQLELIFRSQKDSLNRLNTLALIHRLTEVPRPPQEHCAAFLSEALDHLLHLCPPPSPQHASVFDPPIPTSPMPQHSAEHHQQQQDSTGQQHQQQQAGAGGLQGEPDGYLNARSIANVLWACGELNVYPGDTIMGELTTRFSVLLATAENTCSVASICQCLWALAVFNHQPDERLTYHLVSRTRTVLHTAEPEALGCITWAVAKLKIPASYTMELLPQIVNRSLETFDSHNSQALANIAWGLVELQHYPGDEWTERFVKATKAACRAETKPRPVDIAQWLWYAAYVKPTYDVTVNWVYTLLRTTKYQRVTGSELAMMLLSCVELKQQLPDWWLSSVTHPQSLTLHEQPRALANIVYAFGRQLRIGKPVPIHPNMQRMWFQASLRCMASATPQDCTQMLRALVTLEWAPPAPWLHALHRHTRDTLLEYTPGQCAALLRAWVRIAPLPGRVWMSRFFWLTFRQFSVMKTNEFVGLLYALGLAECQPPQQWMAQWVMMAQQRLPYMSGRELAHVAGALRQLSFQPSHTWTSLFMQRVNTAVAHTHSVTAARLAALTDTISSPMQTSLHSPTQISVYSAQSVPAGQGMLQGPAQEGPGALHESAEHLAEHMGSLPVRVGIEEQHYMQHGGIGEGGMSGDAGVAGMSTEQGGGEGGLDSKPGLASSKRRKQVRSMRRNAAAMATNLNSPTPVTALLSPETADNTSASAAPVAAVASAAQVLQQATSSRGDGDDGSQGSESTNRDQVVAVRYDPQLLHLWDVNTLLWAYAGLGWPEPPALRQLYRLLHEAKRARQAERAAARARWAEKQAADARKDGWGGVCWR